MNIKQSPKEIWQEYLAGQSFKSGIGLYENVKTNEDFYIGNQWQGVSAPDLDKPVMNILKRVISYFLSHIVSDDIAVSVKDFEERSENHSILEMLSAEFARVMENTASKQLFRDMLRDAAVDGDGCIHYYFDTAKAEKTEDFAGTPGEIEAEILQNANVLFGNRQSSAVEKQPYILIAYRRFTQDVKDKAKECKQAADNIKSDVDENGVRTNSENEGKTTVIRKYWKQNGTVWFCEVCEDSVICPAADTTYRRYPLVWMNWEKVKNSFHGQAAITALIPNQIFINKLFAMAMQHVKMLAFPKVIYNRNVFPAGWSNKVGAALAVNGDPNQAVAANFRAADMSNQVLLMIDRVMQYTQETMGASSTALGNIDPRNTSAIIATQKASSMPLELQRIEFYHMVEESVRVWLEIMRANYGVRRVRMKDINVEQSQLLLFDFSVLKDMRLKLDIDIGAASYWSEVMQVQTLDNLFKSGVIGSAETYLKMMPNGILPGRQLLIEEIQHQKAQSAPQSGP